jgi:uncharacterized protein (TIGR00730 family)
VQRVCVFCGASSGRLPAYAAAARVMGAAVAARGLGLVYGGGRVGLMGAVADAALAAGGEVIGVIPQELVDRELGHGGVTKLHVVGSLHERKALMAELSDGFIALPGGSGTLEEMFEVFTWGQLGLHRKGCVLLNVEGYYDRLTAFMDHVVDERFLRPEHRAMMLSADSPAAALAALQGFEPPKLGKWMDRPAP